MAVALGLARLLSRRLLGAPRALGSLAGVIIDAGDRDRAAVGVDADGLAVIFEPVLSLCGAAHEQEQGDGEQPSHHDLPLAEGRAVSERMRIGTTSFKSSASAGGSIEAAAQKSSGALSTTSFMTKKVRVW